MLSEVVAAIDPSLQAHALPEPGPELFGAVPDRCRRFVLEAVHEGYLLHYGTPRAFAGMDDDLRLLAGDALYALGLERLSEAGDIAAVAVLSDLISECARAHAEGQPERAEEEWRRRGIELAR